MTWGWRRQRSCHNLSPPLRMNPKEKVRERKAHRRPPLPYNSHASQRHPCHIFTCSPSPLIFSLLFMAFLLLCPRFPCIWTSFSCAIYTTILMVGLTYPIISFIAPIVENVGKIFVFNFVSRPRFISFDELLRWKVFCVTVMLLQSVLFVSWSCLYRTCCPWLHACFVPIFYLLSC